MPTRQGSIRLFRFAGVDVYLHWWWFLIAVYEIQGNRGYSSIAWNIAEYLGLFVIVLMHEYGHALACRQVGGIADRIVLWPLGGVAYVNPPPRPGATLWSIAAGPLVNVVLLPILYGLSILGRNTGWSAANPNADLLLQHLLWQIDLFLLAFNILPIYPLDGGQILRSLLWFIFGRARSLMVATVIGFIGALGFIGLALWRESWWLGVLAVYMIMNCWGGWQHARALAQFAKLPRRDEFHCPKCQASPPIGEFWKCTHCGQAFDTFAKRATCPHCGTQFPETYCPECSRSSPMREWTGGVVSSSHGLESDFSKRASNPSEIR